MHIHVPLKGKRFLCWDDFRPVEYAAAKTVPVDTFLSLFQGQPIEVAVSQAFHDGNEDVAWRRVAAMTAELDGLWDRLGGVDREDIRHMQSRVQQFVARHQLCQRQFLDVPKCKESFAYWLLRDAAAFAARRHRQPHGPAGDDEDEDMAG